MPLEPHSPAEQAPTTAAPSRRLAKIRTDCCLNCGTAATGNFCAECGQENKAHAVSLGLLLADLLAEVASWDSRLLRTLLPLLLRPGFLTNQYNAGRLVRYLSPLKLYLTISVLFFLLLAWKDPLADAVVISPSGLHVTSRSGPPQAATVSRTNVLLEGAIVSRLLKAQQNKHGFVNALLNSIPKMMFLLLPVLCRLAQAALPADKTPLCGACGLSAARPCLRLPTINSRWFCSIPTG